MGKTTLLIALASEIEPWERLVTIEDAFELGLGDDAAAHPDVLAWQAREANTEGEGAISQAELVRAALRASPDRVIVGEIRGPEVVSVCNVMSQGNDGSMATIHASSARGVFAKMAAYAAQGPERLSMEATNLLVASAVDLVVHLDWSVDGRRVVSGIREVVDAEGRQVISNEVFAPGPDRRARPAAPARADTLERLRGAGWDPDHPTIISPTAERWRDGEGVVSLGAAMAALSGAGFGLGLVLILATLLPDAPETPPPGPRWRRPLLQRIAGGPVWVRDARGRRRAAAAVVVGLVAGWWTGWPVAVALAAAGVWWLPRLLGPDREHEQAVARIEAVAGMGRAAARHPGRGVGVGAGPHRHRPHRARPGRPVVAGLAARIGAGERLPTALARAGVELADPTADLVIAALTMAAGQQARQLAELLAALAAAARAEAAGRLRIAVARARVRTAVRVTVGATLSLAAVLVAFDTPYLQQYESVTGQVVLMGIGVLFAAAFGWLRHIARPPTAHRLLPISGVRHDQLRGSGASAAFSSAPWSAPWSAVWSAMSSASSASSAPWAAAPEGWLGLPGWVWIVLGGAGVGAGVWLVIVGLLPVRPRLADVVATVRARPAPPSSPGEPVRHGPGGWVLRWAGSVAPLLARAGFPGARVRADLRVVEQPEMVLVAATVVSGLAGLLAPVLVSLPLALVGVGWLPGWVWLATAALAAVVPAARVRERAGRRREELRRAVGAVLDLTAIALAGGAGVEQALHGAAQIGAGWAHERLRTTLDIAYTTHADPWSALARLGDVLGVEVLVELGAVLDLAGTEGARVRASLVAKAAALRAHAHSEQEAAAAAATERMSLPVVMLFAAYLVFIGYPALAQVLTL